jgi:hypothetical protein
MTELSLKDVDLGGLAPGRDGQAVVRALGGDLWLSPRTVPHGPRLADGLIELAALPGNANRERILRLLGKAARHNRFEWAPAAAPVRRALRAGLPVLLGFLDDPDPAVRRVVPYVLCEILDEDPGVTVLLHARTAVESDAFALASQLRALDELTEAHGHAVFGDPERARPAAAAWFRSWLDHPSPEVRTVAVGAAAGRCADGTGLAELAVGLLRIEPADRWPDSPWPTRRTRFNSGFGDRLAGHPDQGERYALGMFARDDLRPWAPRAATAVLERWRLPMPRLWAAVAAGLTDDDKGVRKECAELFVAAGPAVTGEHADALRDAALRDGLEAAAVALALIGDERALPSLERRLATRRIGSFGIVGAYRQILFSDLLEPVREYADRLLPAIRAVLADTAADPADMLAGLATWGPACAAAVPELATLLTGRHAEGACAVLGAIGPQAAPLAGELRELALGRRRPEPVRAPVWHGTQRAAWAHWRVTGDPGVALAVIGAAVRRGPGHALLRCLAELGPAAGAYALDVRELLALPGDWNRAEAAHAYWRITGDPGPAVPALLAVLEPLRSGRTGPAVLRAVHHTGALGSAAAPMLPLLAEVIAARHRFTDPLSRRPILDDEALLHAARTADARIRADGSSLPS